MNKIKTLFALAAIAAITLPVAAQSNRVSPHETINSVIDGSQISITYGRPHTKNPKTGEVRKIWGGLVPYGKVWRTGADEATVFTTDKPLMFGDTAVPAGKYTLWTLPAQDGTAKLIINKQVGQWGVGPNSYNVSNDLARVDLKKEALSPTADQFTMAVSSNPGGGGTIKLMWEDTQYSVGFTVQK